MFVPIQPQLSLFQMILAIGFVLIYFLFILESFL